MSEGPDLRKRPKPKLTPLVATILVTTQTTYDRETREPSRLYLWEMGIRPAKGMIPLAHVKGQAAYPDAAEALITAKHFAARLKLKVKGICIPKVME
jgi:hypothetical protein